jgi:hypothetical protein
MATLFFIGTRPQANGRHIVHTEDCPLLPSPEKRLYIGTFLSPEDAAEEGKMHYDSMGYCPFCLHGNHSCTETAWGAGTRKKPVFLTHTRIKAKWESALVFGLN